MRIKFVFLSFFFSAFLSAQEYKRLIDSVLVLEIDPSYNPPKVEPKGYVDPTFEMQLQYSVGVSEEYPDSLIVVIDDILSKTSKPEISMVKRSAFTQRGMNNTITQYIKSHTNITRLRNYYTNRISNFVRKLYTEFNRMKVLSTSDLEQLFATFPLGASPGGTYLVKRENATIGSGGTIYLPRDFKIIVEKDVDNIDWFFRKVIFDEGATIDLNRSTPYPKAGNGSHAVGQPDYGQTGYSGENGVSGRSGLPGTNLELRTYTIPETGNLWIRTDGAPGQDGGDGGNGAIGGGDKCGAAVAAGRIHGGPGGDGGDGGNGGHGGATSKVVFSIIDPTTGSTVKVLPVACANTCGSSSRPGAASGDNGVIVIWGAPGCGGQGGKGGAGGPGHPGRDCGFGRADTHAGSAGKAGASPGRAQEGNCSK